MSRKINITGKVALGFLLMAAVLSVSVIFTFRSMGKMTAAVRVVGEPNKKTRTWQTASRKLTKASLAAQKWKISHANDALLEMLSSRSASSDELAKLHSLCQHNAGQTALADSLSLLTSLWFDNLANRIAVKDTGTQEQFVVDNIMKEMAAHQKMISPELLDSSAARKADSQKIESDKNFLQRIFGKRKKTEVPPAADTPSVSKPVAKALVETNRIKKAIAQGQKEGESQYEIRLKEELEYLSTENGLRDRIRSNSDRFEKLVAEETEALLQSVSVTSSESSQTVATWVSIAAICFMGIFIFIIRIDVLRNRKLNEQLDTLRINAESLAKAKEEFVANMSHEIRTPINIISGFSAQLLKSELAENQRVQAEGIQRSSTHLLSVVNDILDYSKIEAGKIEIEQVGFRPGSIGEDLLIAFESAAREKKVGFSVSVDPKVPEIILGDPVRIRQVLYNLVSNALKFTNKGTVAVSLEAENRQNDSPQLMLSVTDTGIGISKEKTETVFEAFVQADSSITRRYGGTGLGLPISKYLVEKMGGTIAVESEEGVGTKFIVRLPLLAADETDLPEHKQMRRATISLQGKTILICDDEPLNRILAAHIIEAKGGTVIEAESGKEVMDLISEQQPDLILMDLQMPVMSGEEAIRKIRNASSAAIATIPVIALTGRASHGEKEKCLDLGMNGYLSKPYTENELLLLIGEVFSK